MGAAGGPDPRGDTIRAMGRTLRRMHGESTFLGGIDRHRAMPNTSRAYLQDGPSAYGPDSLVDPLVSMPRP